jgi:diacylglycerol kinase (ATP)
MADLLIIVNPRSANGSTGRQWRALERRLRTGLGASFDIAFTERQGHATAIAREAGTSYTRVVAMGGDGTVNEVVNGLIADDRPLRPDLALGIIPRGTGCDFVRTLGIPHDLDGAAARLAAGAVREVDVAKVSYRGADGQEAIRYFINEASIGLGAVICDRVNRASKMLGGRLSFMRATLTTSLRYRSPAISLSLDGQPPRRRVLMNIWVANGRYSGGGIRSARDARLDDGLLDVVQIGDPGFFRKMLSTPKLRSGAFVDLPHVTYDTARRVEASADTTVFFETEGEVVGTLPATFELIGERLNVVA